MADNELEIVLKLVDEASAKLKAALGDAKKEADGLGNAVDKAGKKSENALEKANSKLRDFRKGMLLFAVAIGTVTTSMENLSKRNDKAKETWDRLKGSIANISADLGQALLPAIEVVQKAFAVLDDTIDAIAAGFTKLVSFSAEFVTQLPNGIKEAWERAREVSNIAADNVLDDFRGKVEQMPVIDLEKIIITKNSEKAIKKQKFSIDGLTSALSTLQWALEGAGDENKKFAKAAQALALALAVINTAQGITKAFADYTWPFSMVVAGIVAAAGAIQIGTIASQKLAEGTDTVPAMLSPGEMVFPSTMASAIRRGDISVSGRDGGNAGGAVEVNVYYPQMSTQSDVGLLAEQLGYEIQRKIRGARAFA